MKASAEKSSTTTSTSTTSPFAKATGDKAARPFFAPVQPKLTVGKRDDVFEREADAVAERVVKRPMALPAGGGQAPFQGASSQPEKGAWEEKDKLRRQSWAGSSTPDLQRQEEEPAREPEAKEKVEKGPEKEEPVQAKSISTPAGGGWGGDGAKDEEPVLAKRAEPALLAVTPDLKGRLAERKGEGRPLPRSTQAFMESRFGIDFGHVRIHTDRSSAELGNEIRAEAFTHGSDIYFNQGRYSESPEGQKLLAHELTHVVQQMRSQGVAPKPANRKLVGAKALEPADVAAPVARPAQPSAAPAGPEAPPAAAVPPPPALAPEAAPTPESKETAKGVAPEEEGAPGEKKEIERAPAKPKDDPDFQKAKKGIRSDARKQKDHEPPGKKQTEMTTAAAMTKVEQQEQSAQEQKAAALETAAKPRQKFDRLGFKDALSKKIEKKLPDTEDKAKAFPSSGKLDEAKSEFGATVKEEKGKLTDPLEQTRIAPPPPGVASKPEAEVPPAKPADKPSKIPAQLAAPKPRTDEEISLQEKSDDLDRRMEQEKMTEPQLAESEEPLFEKALVKKQDAQREIAAAPGHYREQEAKVLEKAQQQTNRNTGKGLQQMATVKNKSVGGEGVRGSQTKKESQTEIRQREIKNTINGIYTKTENDVKDILEDLSTAVQIKFDAGAKVANMMFNSRVRSRLDDHYGWFTFDDKIAEAVGLSDGVAHIFESEKDKFLETMDEVLDEIATDVETELNRALLRIQEGRDELKTYKDTLTTEEQKFAEDLFQEVEEKFTDLESTVEDSQAELLETLSDQYVENVGKLQEEFDKINEELGSSWIEDAINFIGEVASALRKLDALLRSIIDRIGELVDEILAAPKRFFNNIVSGVTQGIDKFKSGIGTYLEKGFWMWLTGASGKRKIQIPDKMDPMGMFSLALQMIGIDRAFIMERIKVKLGENVEKLLTRAEAAGEKLLEPVRILIQKGIGALWEWVKAEVSSHLQEIFTKIKKEIFEAIIIKALIWVGTLFVPGLGFIRLVQATYKALRWLVDNIDRIVEIVNAFLDSVALAVKGNVGGIVNRVIKALTLGVVIAIDFLAKLVGLGNFADKLQRAIQSLKKPIQKGIDFVLTKARPVVRKIERAILKAAQAVKKKAKEIKKKLFNWWKARKKFRGGDGATHELYFQGSSASADLMVASRARSVAAFLKDIKPTIAGMPEDKKVEQADAERFWKEAETLDQEIQKLQPQLAKDNAAQKAETLPVQAFQDRYELLQGKMEKLGELLGKLMAVSGYQEAVPPPPILPPFSNNVRARDLQAQYLSGDNNVPAGEIATAHVGNLGAWADLMDEGTRERDNFVRMHLLHHEMGGKATDSNLTPAKSVINSDYYNRLEKHALSEAGLPKRKSTKTRKNKVIWYSVKISYHSGDDFSQNFPDSINSEYGYHDPAQNWQKGPAQRTWSATPGVPDHAEKKYVVNEDGKTYLRKMKYQNKKFKEDFIQLLVQERNEPLKGGGREHYADRDAMQVRLNDRIKKEGWSKSLTGEVTRLHTALQKPPKHNILLNGTDT